MYVCMYVCMHVCMDGWIDACLSVMYVYMYIHIAKSFRACSFTKYKIEKKLHHIFTGDFKLLRILCQV